jgi:CRP/FNR family transcriptional regulator, anaerobic regulatory protein
MDSRQLPEDYSASLTRPEIEALLRRGKRELQAAMSPTPRVLRRGEILVEMGTPHEFVYSVESGWLSRSRTIEDGRRQIIVIFLPGELCAIKTIFMTHQPDCIEALTPASTRQVHFRDACTLAAQDFAVAMHLAWQLALDERHLHNWNVRLGRANAEERLAALLLELRHRLMGVGVGSAQQRYPLPLTQEQIAGNYPVDKAPIGC